MCLLKYLKYKFGQGQEWIFMLNNVLEQINVIICVGFICWKLKYLCET